MSTTKAKPVRNADKGICMFCDGCGWCKGSPAFTCPRCKGTGEVSRQRAYQLRKRELGQCVTCGKPKAPSSALYCPTHVHTERERARRRTNSSPWRQGRPGRPPND